MFNNLKRMILKFIKRGILYTALLLSCFGTVIPLIWTISSSFKNRIDIVSTPPVWFFSPVFSNYKRIMVNFPTFPLHLMNTIITSIISVTIVLTLSLLAAYAVSRFNFKLRGIFLLVILVHRMIPEVSLGIPFYVLIRKVGLYDTLIAVILSMIAVSSPFAVWLLSGFIGKIPRELEEFALVDGCNNLNAFIKITIPLMLPGLGVTFIFCFLMCWNLFLLPYLLTSTKALTLAPLIVKFNTEFGIEWGPLTALATIIFIPLLIMASIIQKYLVSGLTLGAIKG